jgi:signal peptidase I
MRTQERELPADRAPVAHAARHRWRENVEALTMAIVVALLFKYFVLEISKIPSGSMQPTLMGNPETGVFDRTLVDKLSFRFRDPRRFEIVVFKHPLERSRIMVKRLVGMPGEELRIEHGDLWIRAGADEPWKHLRRPASVQREAWRALTSDARLADWSVVRGGKEWHVSADGIVARGDGAARFRASAGPITDRYLDGYPAPLIDEIELRDPTWGRHAVGDVRLEGELRALPGTTALTFELTEGQRVYEFTLPGPLAPADAEVVVRIRDSAAAGERVERGERLRLAAGARQRFALENLDDRLAFELDGRTVLAAEIAPSARQEASLTIGVAGAGADLESLRVSRDVYYLTPEDRASWSVRIPPGNYVMLGDNTQDSADGRLWKAKTYSYRRPDGAVVEARGNYREGNENPTTGSLGDSTPAIRFRDRWGEIHWFARKGITAESLPGNEPLVPRELILGRALAVFWPIRPIDRLWRVGWLH